MDKLTEKQKRFIDYYIQTGNATESAILAGYSENSAKQIGSGNLTKLDTYIKERLDKKEDERIATADEVLRYLTAVLRGEEKDQFGFDASLKDRNKAAELLGKRYMLFTDKVEQTNKGEINVLFNIPRPVKDEKNGHSN